MQVLSLDQEDLLEEGMATHSSILENTGKIPWTEPGRLQLQRAGHDNTHMHACTRFFFSSFLIWKLRLN